MPWVANLFSIGFSLKDKSKFWSYVTIFGTLWGGLELTVGTFLHVLHVPKTGLIMVTLSVILLMAQRHVFPVRGSTLAAGVVAACIKGLSPGGIIAGPIFGILSEALIVEICLLMGSRHVLAGMYAGGMAVFWCQIQSLFTIWLYYGQDFIDGVVRIVEKFFRIEWTAAIGWSLIGGFLAIVIGLGAVAGWMGWRLGGRILRFHAAETCRALRDESEGAKPPSALCTDVPEHVPAYAPTPDAGLCPATPPYPQAESSKNSENTQPPDFSGIVFARKNRQDTSVNVQAASTRRYVFPIALITLVAQFGGDILWSSGALAVWLLTLLIAARGVIRSIWWPKFWALTFGVSLICGIMLAWSLDGSWQWHLGAEATARMMVRGVYVFSLVNWFTRCIRSEEFLSVWQKIHLPELGQALVDAYSLLPRWLDRLNAMLETRPAGIRNTCRYIRECLYLCLLDATREAGGMQSSFGAPPQTPPRG